MADFGSVYFLNFSRLVQGDAGLLQEDAADLEAGKCQDPAAGDDKAANSASAGTGAVRALPPAAGAAAGKVISTFSHVVMRVALYLFRAGFSLYNVSCALQLFLLVLIYLNINAALAEAQKTPDDRNVSSWKTGGHIQSEVPKAASPQHVARPASGPQAADMRPPRSGPCLQRRS